MTITFLTHKDPLERLVPSLDHFYKLNNRVVLSIGVPVSRVTGYQKLKIRSNTESGRKEECPRSLEKGAFLGEKMLTEC